MRTVIHRVAYFVTAILAVAAAFVFEQILADWAEAQGYDSIVKAGVTYMVDAGIDGLVLAGFLFLLGCSLAFIVDDMFRRRADKGANGAHMIICWAGGGELKIEPAYNMHYGVVQPLPNSSLVWMMFEQPVLKAHLFAISTKMAVRIRELHASERFMHLEIDGNTANAEVLICVVAERKRSPTARRQAPRVWDGAVYMPEISREFAYGKKAPISDRLRGRVIAIVYRLRRLLPST